MIKLNPDKASCGCDFRDRCDCKLKPFTVRRTQLRAMNKGDLFVLYSRCLNDEMSPITWRGFLKSEILEMFLSGQDSVELTPFI
ncbi:MAG: hypothetical protein ACXAC5_02245 [Promethearchaeota archaeon]|jgi:hypothetical protein